MKKTKFKFFKGNAFFGTLLLGSVLLLLLFIGVATISGAWPGSDISAQILSALAGAVVTAIITMFLLLGQTFNEEKKERNSKIFEEKLRIYNEFLQKLCSVVKDMKIEKSEEIELEFQVAQIAMHTSSKSIKEISAQVRDMIVRIKKNDAQQNEMLAELFEIADVFYNELYNKENEYEEMDRDKTIENFSSILLTQATIQSYEESQRKEVIEAYKETTYYNMSDRAKLLKAKINSQGSRHWIYSRTTLVHDFYTDVNPDTHQYYETPNQISVDITPNNSTQEYTITLFVRTWNLEKIKQIANEIWPSNTFPEWPIDEPCRLLYKKVSFSEIDSDIDAFAKEMEDLLSRIRVYRDSHYPLK